MYSFDISDPSIPKLTLTLTDGDIQWDGDGTANGRIVDPGMPGNSPTKKGGGSNDLLEGFNTDDLIFGYGGRDILRGLGGSDQIYGGNGLSLIHI